MSTYKAVISDLDGTLLNDQHTLSDYSKQIFRQLHDKGVRLMIATGRHHVDTQNIKAKLGIDAYTITSNGATVADESGQLIYEKAIDPQVVKAILDMPQSEEIARSLYQGKDWVMERSDVDFSEYYKEGGFVPTIAPFEDRLTTPTNKIFYVSYNEALLKQLAADIIDKYGHAVVHTFSLPFCLEIMAKGVNKGDAIKHVFAQEGLELHEAIAFGDGMNDIEMLEVVGKGCVMGNAIQKVRDTVPQCEVIGLNSEDAVAKKLVAEFGML